LTKKIHFKIEIMNKIIETNNEYPISKGNICTFFIIALISFCPVYLYNVENILINISRYMIEINHTP
jgi:hypothetical protein